ncbi:MAG: carboxypeptidase regulatory-like domain-containing protein, partial [Pedobacter sp.]
SDGRQFLQVPLTVNRNQNIDLQFLPEGGHLVAGLKSKVGFKALAEDGHGTSVSGVIIDKAGAEQANFKTLYNGMGSFDFTPKTGQIYTAVLKDVAGNEKSYNLPKVEPFGTVMHVINDENSETLAADILASANAITADSAFYLIATTNDKLYFSKKIESAQDDIQIDKSLFPTGITKLTLLKGNRPLNERIIYIDHKDQLKVNIINDKPGYLKRENVDLIVEVKDKNGMPVKGNFSLSVTDESQVKTDSIGNYNINTGLLLNSALKGKVENPGYYLQRNEPTAWQALDNLMLTQGWTGYSWAQVFNNPAPKHIAEKDFKITGKVVSMLNKPVPNAPVLISSQKPSFINTTLTDQYGKFTFAKLPQIDSGSFFFQAQTAQGKTKKFGAIEIDRVLFPSVPETYRNPVLPWYVNTDTTQVNYVKRIAEKNNEASLKQGGIALKEVSIQSKKIIKGSFLRSGGGNSDLAFDEKDIKESAVMNLYQILKQKLPGLRIVVDEGETAVLYNDYLVAIGIDGGELPIYAPVGFPITVEQLIEQMSQFQIASIVGIEVVYSRKFMGRYVRRSISGPDQYISGFVGMNDHDYLSRRASGPNKKERLHAFIEITTKDGKGWHINDNANAVTYRPLPVMHPQEFYSPKYTATSTVAEPDYRSTLYWSPNIYTDASGRAKVSFHTSDVVGAYNVNVQGTGTNGGLGSANGKIKTKNL